jgi:hypothetical protein
LIDGNDSSRILHTTRTLTLAFEDSEGDTMSGSVIGPKPAIWFNSNQAANFIFCTGQGAIPTLIIYSVMPTDLICTVCWGPDSGA